MTDRHLMNVVECSLPANVTLPEYRRSRPRRRTVRNRLRALLQR